MKIFEVLNSDKKLAVVYGGRFQPPTPGHYAVYKMLVNFFGENNVFLATSDKTDINRLEKYKKKLQKSGDKNIEFKLRNFIRENIKSPFNYFEKVFIWNRIFGVSKNKIIKSLNPAFNPVEILNKFGENTVYVAVTSEKDKDRYTKSKYFRKYPIVNNLPVNFDSIKFDLKPYTEKGYYIVVPILSDDISATKVRNIFLSDISVDRKKELFKKVYGKFDRQVFNLMLERLGNLK